MSHHTQEASPSANSQRIARLFDRLAAANPDPRTELIYGDAFTLLVSVVLSAQTTDVAVNKATRPLFAAASTPTAMAALREDGIRPFIASLGLFRTKARNVAALSQILIDHHGGLVPNERAALEALPGVGRKTASVVLNELGIEPAIAVDTHVFRVAHRLALSNGKTPDQVEQNLMQIVPEIRLTRAHHWLILLGRYICLARKPKCAICPVLDLCSSPEKTA